MSGANGTETVKVAETSNVPPIGSRWSPRGHTKPVVIVAPCKGRVTSGALRDGVAFKWEATGLMEWCCEREWRHGFYRLPDMAASEWEEVSEGNWRLFLPKQRLCLWLALGDTGWHWQADSLDGPPDAPALAVDDGTQGMRREEAQAAAEAWAAERWVSSQGQDVARHAQAEGKGGDGDGNGQ